MWELMTTPEAKGAALVLEDDAGNVGPPLAPPSPTPKERRRTPWTTSKSRGRDLGTSVVGNDGAIGVALFMGGETTTNRAVVQSAGSAYQMTGARLKEEFERHGELLHILLRYTQALITQMAQTAVCNRHHSVDQQLCRWLLLSLDRLSSDQLAMTQELIANMLGVRREGVTEATGKLQKLGVIRYRRGEIAVLDRPRLEQLCCECYGVVKTETDRLLPLRTSHALDGRPPTGSPRRPE
jgi:CRP-like cAMP-binding protein